MSRRSRLTCLALAACALAACAPSTTVGDAAGDGAPEVSRFDAPAADGADEPAADATRDATRGDAADAADAALEGATGAPDAADDVADAALDATPPDAPGDARDVPLEPAMDAAADAAPDAVAPDAPFDVAADVATAPDGSAPDAAAECVPGCPAGEVCRGGACRAGPWAIRFGGAATDTAYGLAVDGAGNAYVVGAFTGTTDLGGGPLASAGSFDVFVASYDATGAHRWSRRYGGGGADFAEAVAVDAAGNVHVAGRFERTVDFGGGPVTSAGSFDAFVASYDASGAHRWSRGVGASEGDLAWGLAVDGAGNAYVTGTFRGAVDFGGGALASGGGGDAFVASYDARGAHRWSRRFGGRGGDDGRAVAVGPGGVVWVGGQMQDAVDFGGGPIATSGIADGFLVALDGPTGAHRWSRRVGTAEFDAVYALAVDGAGNAYVTGRYASVVRMSGGGIETVVGVGDAFVGAFDPAGAPRWVRRWGGAFDDHGIAVTTDRAGNVFASGLFQDRADFGGGVLVTAGNGDAFVVSLDASGAHRWSRRFGGTSTDWARGIAVDAAGDVRVAGGFGMGPADFGARTLTSAGGEDGFLMKLVP